MPKAEIQTTMVTVILEGNEASVQELADRALALYRSVRSELPSGPSIAMGAGSHIDRRGTYNTHEPIDTGGVR